MPNAHQFYRHLRERAVHILRLQRMTVGNTWLLLCKFAAVQLLVRAIRCWITSSDLYQISDASKNSGCREQIILIHTPALDARRAADV